ncbi:MAG: hypothetical protein ABJA67_14500, partial [Chthonomonadales bacterium]
AAYYNENSAVRHLRGQLPIYIKGFRGANQARERIVRATTIAEVQEIFDMVLDYQNYVPEAREESELALGSAS